MTLRQLQGLAIFLCHVIFNDKVKSKLCSYLQRKFEVIHEDALSRADTTKKTVIIVMIRFHISNYAILLQVRRKYLGRNDTEMSFAETSSTSQSQTGPGPDTGEYRGIDVK